MSTPASTPPTSRAELLARLRTSTKDEIVLDDMQRLGFWPKDAGQPTLAEDLIRREAELSTALRELGRQLQGVADAGAALKALRKERMAKARARREETRQRRARERFERASAWHARRQREVLYLGADVSAGLSKVASDHAKLTALGLPVMDDARDLATAMGITLPELRFLAFDRRVSRISHYRRFALPKKSGGERIISAPMPRLKRAQYWVLDRLLANAALHPGAHGFVKGRSIVSNALPHVGQDVVINLDLKNFFPSIAMPRIKGVFAQMGYSEQLATTLALLCTEAATEQVSVDGEQYFVACGERALPQGAPSSPALTNILCRRLDARLSGCAAKLGFTYTRYADDLTFSAPGEARKLAGKLLWRVKQIVIDEGFTPHPDKQHVMRRAQRQTVTGVVVNQKPAIARDTLRRFRATLFQVERDGPEGKQWNGNSNVIDALEGYAQFVKMVDADKGAPLLARVRAVRERWAAASTVDLASASASAKRSSAFRALAAQGQAPWDGWWQPVAEPAPVPEKTADQVRLDKRALKAGTQASQTPAQQAPGYQAGAYQAPAYQAPANAMPASSPLPSGGSKPASAARVRVPRIPSVEQAADTSIVPTPWGPLAIQLALTFTLAATLMSFMPLFVALITIPSSFMRKQPRWLAFGVLMLFALLVVLWERSN